MPTANSRPLPDWAAIYTYLFAGNATFTLVSLKTGQRFTYRVRQAKVPNDGGERPYFVSLLRGPSNTEDYAYMGIIDEAGFHSTTKSRVSPDAASHKAFKWLLDRMKTGGAMTGVAEVWHDGTCGRCGRALTVPSSVALGLGPECAGRAA